jgi:hypothetical protein
MRTLTSGLLFVALAPSLWAEEAKKTTGSLVPNLRSGSERLPEAIHVPYRLTDTNHVLIRVKINGKGPYNFILDTGAPAVFVSTAVCRKLAVEADKEGWGTFDRFELEGGVVLKEAKGRVEDPFQLEGMNGLGLAGAQLHGIIGYTLLARYRLEFDFTKHKLAWTPLGFDPPAPEGLDGKGAAAGMEAMGNLFKLLGTLLGKKPEPQVVLRGFLGIALEEGNKTVIVQSVLAKSPAASSGLKPGDRIDRFQGKAVTSAADIHRLAAKLAPDETARLTVMRGPDTLSIEIKAGQGL